MSAIVSQITGNSIVCSTDYLCLHNRQQSSVLFVVFVPFTGWFPSQKVIRKTFPYCGVIIHVIYRNSCQWIWSGRSGRSGSGMGVSYLRIMEEHTWLQDDRKTQNLYLTSTRFCERSGGKTTYRLESSCAVPFHNGLGMAVKLPAHTTRHYPTPGKTY